MHREEPAGTLNRLLNRTPASLGKIAVVCTGLHLSACCLPEKVLLLRKSEACCVAFLSGSWRSGPFAGGPGSHWAFLGEGDTLEAQ